MTKILTFAWKQLHTVYSDTTLLLFIILTPLTIATIVGLAFGGQDGNISISDIPVVIVNLDEGGTNGNFGELVTNILASQAPDDTDTDDGNLVAQACSLVDDADTTNNTNEETAEVGLDTLFDATILDDVELAKAGVDEGTYFSAVIIPADFSQLLTPSTDFSAIGSDDIMTIESARVEIYGNGSAPISSGVVRAVTESVVSQMVTGSTTINATIRELLNSNPIALATAGDSAFANFACAFRPDLSTLQLERIPLDDVQGESSFVQLLLQIGAAQAVFFAMFSANQALGSIYEDRESWILQRLFITPTPRIYLIIGKILGALLLVMFQVSILLLALTVIASLVTGEVQFIWGQNIPLLIVHTLATALSISGLGVFIVGIAPTYQTSQIIGTLVNMAMAILGGAFGFSLGAIEQLSVIFWGVDGYESLAAGSTDIGLNMIILLGVGLVFFVVGLVFFNRQATE